VTLKERVGSQVTDQLHAIYERITVAGPEIVGVRLTAAAYAHGFAFDMPIEGRDEWLAAARRLA
jgi:hypothetical protein